MKHGIFLFMLVLAGFSPLGLSAQNGQPPRSMQEILMSRKWYPDIYDEEDEETYFRIYTKDQRIDSVTTEEGELKVYGAVYYLSDTPDNVFDKDKVGKASSGQYMITPGYEKYGIGALIVKFLVVSDEKLVIQQLTPGMSAYLCINTWYP
ncbi:MAG: hypothetical protein K2I90_03790, partial [Odoribacter sp.]|nr:hypothetical protein [Odoribacter sp.]